MCTARPWAPPTSRPSRPSSDSTPSRCDTFHYPSVSILFILVSSHFLCGTLIFFLVEQSFQVPAAVGAFYAGVADRGAAAEAAWNATFAAYSEKVKWSIVSTQSCVSLCSHLNSLISLHCTARGAGRFLHPPHERRVASRRRMGRQAARQPRCEFTNISETSSVVLMFSFPLFLPLHLMITTGGRQGDGDPRALG